jgi:hypothetical protein
MVSFSQFLLQEGVDLEVRSKLDEVITFLDGEVPKFQFNGYGYRLTPQKGFLRSQWNLVVRTWELAGSAELAPALAFLEVGELESGSTRLKVLPGAQKENNGAAAFDQDGKLFGGFAFQLLNALQRRGLIDLPGELPIQ